MDRELEELKSVNSNLDYACNIIMKRKINTTHSKNDLEDWVNIQIDIGRNKRKKKNNQSLNSEEGNLEGKVSPQSVKQLPYNNLIKNIHHLTNKFTENKPMNIILTTNNNANTGDDVEGNSENEQQANENDSWSTNDSLLDQEINNDVEQRLDFQNLQNLNEPSTLLDERRQKKEEDKELKPNEESKLEDDIPPEEYERYKRDILNELKKEKDKLDEVQFNDMFDFSRDFNNPYEGRNTSRDEKGIEINDLSALDWGMEEVKELKRLLYLAKMKFRKENKSTFQNMQNKGFKIKKKWNSRKIKTGYAKKRFIKQSRDKMADRNRLLSYEVQNPRWKLSSENTIRNQQYDEYFLQSSLFNNDYALKNSNFVRNKKHEHQQSIEKDKRSTFYGNFENRLSSNWMNGLSNEGFKTDNFKSRRSLVRCSSTNFNARLSHPQHPDYQTLSNLPSDRNKIPNEKRLKTSQQIRARKTNQSKIW